MGVVAGVAAVSRRLPSTRTKVRVARAVATSAMALGASGEVECTVDLGARLLLDARSRTEVGAIFDGTADAHTIHQVVTLAGGRPAVVFDVGANVGLVGVPVARALGPAATVHLFEPVAVNCARLRHNLALNGLTNCVVHEVALGAESGEIEIAREDRLGAPTGNAILAPSSGSLPAGYGARSTVRIERLDDLVAAGALPDPDVIKIDVEGAEVEFLRGAATTLARARPFVAGEFNSALMPLRGTTFLDAFAACPDRYDVYAFGAGGVPVRVEPHVGLGNVLLAPAEKAFSL